MTEQELYKLLMKCIPSQLDAITATLGIDDAYLPPRNEAVATRTAAILKVVQQPGGVGLAALEGVLNEIFGRKPLQPAEPAERARCILILAANPVDTDQLRLGDEIKKIRERLREGDQGRRYRVETEWSVSANDLSRCLLEHKPTIVHFSGHGSPTGEIVLQGENGKTEVVPARALVGLFRILKRTEIVVLNACYTTEQARALAQVVPQVIGMSRAIGDDSALRFAAGFYRGLAYGENYTTAFQLGCNEIDLAALPDGVVPHFTTQGEEHIAPGTRAAPAAESIALPMRQRTWRSLVKPDQAATQPDEDPPGLCSLWYGTNRRPVDPDNPARGYTGERDDDHVHYGTCKVAVPKSHKIGSVGSSWWDRLLTWEDDRLKLVELAGLAESDYWCELREAAAKKKPGERRALVFIHGFNVGFDDAALRAAQIAADLKFPGIKAFYSWPSKGSLLGYKADEASIEASESQITGFLTRLAADSGVDSVDVLAHSMGNRGLLRSLQRIMEKAAQAGRVPFGQLLLAAPDIDQALFRDLAKGFALGQRTTLYVSSRDKALKTSGIVHDYARAGYAPPVTVMQGIDTVEVSNVDLTFLGHGYYAAARDLLHDMQDLLLHNSPPASRLGLMKMETPEGLYWEIGA